MLDQCFESGVGGAGFAVGLEQAHGAAVAIHGFKPVDGFYALRYAHGVGLDEGVGLFLGGFTGVVADLCEPDGDVGLGWALVGQQLSRGGDDVHEDGFGAPLVFYAAHGFVGVESGRSRSGLRAPDGMAR